MRTYRVISTAANINSGIVELTIEQAKTRRHHLEPAGGNPNHYLVLGAIQFKRGEQVGWDGQPNKAQLQELEPVAAASASECTTESAPRQDKKSKRRFGKNK